MARNPLTERQQSHERALEQAVSRALRDNLIPLQRTAEELQQAYADLVAACSSSRPSNALPAMLRAQTSAAALAAGLSVLSNFVAVALRPREDTDCETEKVALAESEARVGPQATEQQAANVHIAEPEWVAAAEEATAASTEIPLETVTEPLAASAEPVSETAAFDVSTLPTDLQELHRRANRVAKVAMQDIKLLRPKDVRLGRENKDICTRLRADLDKARKEYDRRFRGIQDHPIDYFHRWMVEILGEGDSDALGEYPYPSPVLRH
jgi:hypothetical protein